MSKKEDVLLRVVGAHEAAINVVKLTYDGSYCMTGSEDRTIKLFNPHKDDPSKISSNPLAVSLALQIKTYSGNHGYGISDITIAHDNSKFASVGGDKAAFLSDVSTGRVIRRIQAHTQRINAVDMNVDGTVLMTASYDQTACLWDLRSNNRDPLMTLREFTDSVSSITHTKSAIITGCVDGKVRIYDLRHGLLHTDDVTDAITSVRVTNDERTFLCTSLGGVIRLCDIELGNQLNTYSGHQHTSYKIEACVSNDDLEVIAGSEDGGIYHWDLLTGESSFCTKNAHLKPISSICHHPSKAVFVTSSHDKIAKCWETRGV